MKKKVNLEASVCNYSKSSTVLQFKSDTPCSAVIRFLEFSASEQKNIGGLTSISLSKIFFLSLQRTATKKSVLRRANLEYGIHFAAWEGIGMD